MMSPEMGEGQWKSMRSTPPKVDLKTFDLTSKIINLPAETKQNKEIITIEAERFTKANSAENFNWKIIKGLGKSGDSVAVFPQIAKTFTAESPNLEFKFSVNNSAEYEAEFYLIPTQPLVPNNGLRFAFSIDNDQLQTIVIDKDTEVSSRKWAENILTQQTVSTVKIKLTKGTHTLKIFAVDTGVILDKIVMVSKN